MSTLLKILIWSLPASSLAHEGNSQPIPEGGDIVFCEPSSEPDSPKPGAYALDYLITLGLDFGGDRSVESWERSKPKIRNIIARNIPEYIASYDLFTKYIRGYRQNNPHVWMHGTVEFRKIHDFVLVSRVPENCRSNDFVTTQIAIIRKEIGPREKPDSRLLYIYQYVWLDRLEKTSPLQLSMLYVHEWLWNISKNSFVNRRVNKFLHSKSVMNLSRSQVRAQLKGMGLQLNIISYKYGPLNAKNHIKKKNLTNLNCLTKLC